jgi:hypothetical protein
MYMYDTSVMIWNMLECVIYKEILGKIENKIQRRHMLDQLNHHHHHHHHHQQQQQQKC